jgi:hypothetical protein
VNLSSHMDCAKYSWFIVFVEIDKVMSQNSLFIRTVNVNHWQRMHLRLA